MKETIIAFLSSRTNLTIFQCLLYFVVGHMMGEYLSWGQIGIMFVVLFGSFFILFKFIFWIIHLLGGDE